MLTTLACRALRYKAAQRLVVHMATAMRRHWRYAPGYAALPLRLGYSITILRPWGHSIMSLRLGISVVSYKIPTKIIRTGMETAAPTMK
jgi:hypothetical protein